MHGRLQPLVNNRSLFNRSTVNVELEGDLLLAQEAGSTRATLDLDKDPRNLDRINGQILEWRPRHQSSKAGAQLPTLVDETFKSGAVTYRVCKPEGRIDTG